jgi:hypothetical protein
MNYKMTTTHLTDQEWKNIFKNPATHKEWKDKMSTEFLGQNRLLTMCKTQQDTNTFVDNAIRN